MSDLFFGLFTILFIMFGVGVVGLIFFVLDKKYPTKATISGTTTIKEEVVKMGAGKIILFFVLGFLVGLLVFC